MLLALADAHTVTLLALERRHDDGAEEFFAQAAAAGFESRLLLRHEHVLVCEMQMARRAEEAS